MNPTETPTQTPPAPSTAPAPESPLPAPDPATSVGPVPAGQPPIAPVNPSPTAKGGKSKMMLYGVVGLVVLIVIIYFLVK